MLKTLTILLSRVVVVVVGKTRATTSSSSCSSPCCQKRERRGKVGGEIPGSVLMMHHLYGWMDGWMGGNGR